MISFKLFSNHRNCCIFILSFTILLSIKFTIPSRKNINDSLSSERNSAAFTDLYISKKIALNLEI